MKRDARLRALSRDHHHALVLARFIAAIDLRAGLDVEVVNLLKERFATEILPHFEVEEILLTALVASGGADDLVKRTRDDHARMMRLVGAASATDASPLAELAQLLTDHVRFEERELYLVCEERLPAQVLEQVARAHRDHDDHDDHDEGTP